MVTEVLSQAGLPPDVADLIRSLASLEITAGYWERAGVLRARVLAKGRRARLVDSLIAQVCLDHDVRLVTHDADFKSFAEIAGLRILP